MDELTAAWTALGQIVTPAPADDRPWVSPADHVYLELSGPHGSMHRRWLVPYLYERHLMKANEMTIDRHILFLEPFVLTTVGVYFMRHGGDPIYTHTFEPIHMRAEYTFHVRIVIQGIIGELLNDMRINRLMDECTRMDAYDYCR